MKLFIQFVTEIKARKQKATRALDRSWTSRKWINISPWDRLPLVTQMQYVCRRYDSKAERGL